MRLSVDAGAVTKVQVVQGATRLASGRVPACARRSHFRASAPALNSLEAFSTLATSNAGGF